MRQVGDGFGAARLFRARVLEHVPLASGFFRLKLASPPGLASPIAGQFLHIRIPELYTPLLRRPFSFYDATPGSLTIVYKVVGKGTQRLSRLQPGEEVDAFGPLGNGFTICPQKRQHILVGGGIGVAPLTFLARVLLGQSKPSGGNIRFIGGFRCAADLVCVDTLPQDGKLSLLVRTDDGTAGQKGVAHDALAELIASGQLEEESTLYACGPRPMLREIAHIGAAHGIATQVLLEEIVACGIGVCQGCVVRGAAGYLRVCTDGPVFDAGQINWSSTCF